MARRLQTGHPDWKTLMEPALRMSPAQGRLLVVDDEENILKSLRRVLRSEDWEIRTALDGERGLQILEQFTPEVVISDFRLPGMNGADFLAQVKQRIPLAQRIMLTGHADQRAIEEAINRSEIFRFIAKPWNDSALLLTVQSAFEQYAVHAGERAPPGGHPRPERGAPGAERRARGARAAAHPAPGRGQAGVGAVLRLAGPAAGGGARRGPQRPPGQRRLRAGRGAAGPGREPEPALPPVPLRPGHARAPAVR